MKHQTTKPITADKLFKHQHIVRSGIEIVDFIPKMTNFGDGSEGDASQAVAFANENKIGGHSDWVIPCRATLLALCDTKLFTAIRTYWSSSKDFYSDSISWSILFFEGNLRQDFNSRFLNVRLVLKAQQTDILRLCVIASSGIKPL